MKKYTIVTHSVQYHEYRVEAESMEEAKLKVSDPLQDGVEYIRTDSEPPTDDHIVHGSCEEIKTYPFSEGDTYYTIEDGEWVLSCWDFVSEEMHDENPNKVYYREKNKESIL